MALRVLYFVANFHRFSGAQQSLYLFVRALDRAQIEPLVVLPGEGPATRMFRELGVQVDVLPGSGTLTEFGGSLKRARLARRAAVAVGSVLPYALKLAQLMRRRGVDLAHCNDARAVLIAGPAARLVGVPVVMHVRGEVGELGAAYLKACGVLANRLVLVAANLMATLPPYLQRKSVVLRDAIEPVPETGRRDRQALLRSLNPPLQLPADGVLAVEVATVIPLKGGRTVIEALGILKARSPAVAEKLGVVFVGDCPQASFRAELESRVAELGLTNVRFAGWDDAPLDWFRAADVALLPSTTEGMPRSVLEGMALGKPILATTVGGIPEAVLNEETGLLVPPSQPESLALALERLVSDDRLRERLGAAGRRRAEEQFAYPALVRDTVQLYRELAERS
jgi:glycosyltransferase involved in cell wall biosynthesis